MKLNSYPVIFLFFALIYCCHAVGQVNADKAKDFLHKTPAESLNGRLRQHIEVKEILPETEEWTVISPLDDRDKISRSRFSREEKVKILSEYLGFRGDTALSDKRYFLYLENRGVIWSLPLNRDDFTIEIEALFSFTRMLTKGISTMQPELVDNRTGMPINRDREKINEVFRIYKKWLKKQIKSRFSNFWLPLENSPYQWVEIKKDIPVVLDKYFY